MVVVRPALHQTSAGYFSINTKVCCVLLGVEYAGYGMDHPASDRSDRQLRPRALCLRCKRLESLCACKKQRQPTAHRTSMATTSTSTRSTRASQVAGQLIPDVTEEVSKSPPSTRTSTSSRSHPKTTSTQPSSSGPAPDITEPTMELMSVGTLLPTLDFSSSAVLAGLSLQPVPSVSSVMEMAGVTPLSLVQLRTPPTPVQIDPSGYSNLMLQEGGKVQLESSSSDASSSSSSSSSSSYESNGTQRGEISVSQPSMYQPSTSQHVPICDTPKRTSLEVIPRRIFTSTSKKSARSVQATQAKGKQPVHTVPTKVVKPTRKSPPDVFKGSVSSESGEGISEPSKTAGRSSKARKNTPKRSRTQKAPARGSSKGTPIEEIGSEPPSVPSTSRGSSQKGHVCPECGKAFGSPGKLSQHMFSHTGERPFPCTQCSKAFSSKFKLVRHNLIHSTVRRFVCGTCGRQFHRKDHLQNHAKIHAAVKLKFRCDREGCNKEYTSANSARKHSAAHAAQDGQLDCTLCGKHFATTPDVLHHLKVHAGSRAVKTQADRKFTCDVCSRSFFTRKDVRRHYVVHTGLRDFLCQFCPQRFGRKDHLVRHIKKSHQTGWTKIRRKTRRVASSVGPSDPLDTGSSPGPSTMRDTSPITVQLKQEPEDVHLVEVKEEVIQPQELPNMPIELPAEIPLYPPPPYMKSEADVPPPYPKSPVVLEETYPKPPVVLNEPYPKPPVVLEETYPKSTEDLSQLYSIDPDIQRLFTAESGNGQLLMSLMESVELSSANRDAELLPSTSQQVLPPTLEMMQSIGTVPQGLSLADQMMSTAPSGSGDSQGLGLCDPSLAEQLLVSPTPVSSSTSRAVMETLLREEGDKNSAPLPRFDQAFPPQ